VYTSIVYTEGVKNITLSADERLIENARATARRRHTTLNAAFRQWLEEYVARYQEPEKAAAEFDAAMERLSYVRAGRKFSRDEMNER
jgi:hypothetical protein